MDRKEKGSRGGIAVGLLFTALLVFLGGYLCIHYINEIVNLAYEWSSLLIWE